MQLRRLLEGVKHRSVSAPLSIELAGLAYDSRKVERGFLFAALKGEKTDGNVFVSQAIARGASAVISEESPSELLQLWIEVENGRRALAQVSANFFGRPTQRLSLIGITGTNGKTSTAYLVESVLKAAGLKVGLISTIEYRSPAGRLVAERTTPESLDLQKLLAEFLAEGCQQTVMEVSSHALAMERVYACRFRTAVFTNLTQDHLDFHHTLENYFQAKLRLFLGTGLGPPQQSVINIADPWGKRLAEICSGRCLTYSISGPADFQLVDYRIAESGMHIQIKTPSGDLALRSRLMGRPNLANILAAAACGYDLGIELKIVQQGIESCNPVPGRFELIDCGQTFRVVVDYAHTADALEKVLSMARDLNPNRVLLLFGCGGERDRTKRPVMGAIARARSDFFVITSDNPRSEDPLAIIREIEAGFTGDSSSYRVEPDRESAIREILRAAKPGDVVILAGKGHESYQVLADKSIPFDDRHMARNVLREMGYGHEAFLS